MLATICFLPFQPKKRKFETKNFWRFGFNSFCCKQAILTKQNSPNSFWKELLKWKEFSKYLALPSHLFLKVAIHWKWKGLLILAVHFEKQCSRSFREVLHGVGLPLPTLSEICMLSIRFFTTVVRIVDIKFTRLKWHFNYSDDSGKWVDRIEHSKNKIAFQIRLGRTETWFIR